MSLEQVPSSKITEEYLLPLYEVADRTESEPRGYQNKFLADMAKLHVRYFTKWMDEQGYSFSRKAE